MDKLHIYILEKYSIRIDLKDVSIYLFNILIYDNLKNVNYVSSYNLWIFIIDINVFIPSLQYKMMSMYLFNTRSIVFYYQREEKNG